MRSGTFYLPLSGVARPAIVIDESTMTVIVFTDGSNDAPGTARAVADANPLLLVRHVIQSIGKEPGTYHDD